jgi:hypothetical protein
MAAGGTLLAAVVGLRPVICFFDHRAVHQVAPLPARTGFLFEISDAQYEAVFARTNSGNRPAIDDHNLAIHKTVAFADHERGVFGQLGRAAQSTC